MLHRMLLSVGVSGRGRPIFKLKRSLTRHAIISDAMEQKKICVDKVKAEYTLR